MVDIWHYPRTALAKQVLGMFESGLSNALVFFAPRRMGKTEFLLKDMRPIAREEDWSVLYFSFLDASANAREAFTLALIEFAVEVGAVKQEKFQKKIKKVEGGFLGIHGELEFRDPKQAQSTIKEVFSQLAKHHHKVLLLLDEVQIISQDKKNRHFVAALRTAFDINKDTIKVIFTGSSREGLRQMFSKADAPFFHFGQNLPFPELQEDFIEHLAEAFNKATCRKIETRRLWNVFVEMGRVPQLIRSLVERLVLLPDLSLQKAKEQLLADIVEDREYLTIWMTSSVLERLLLKAIVMDETELFSKTKRDLLAAQMGIDDLPTSTVQSTIRTFLRKNIIGSLAQRGAYYIDDPNFKDWIEKTVTNNESG